MKLKFNALKAALLYVAKKDVRFYLEGVHVTKDTIEATNGHILFQYDNSEVVQDGCPLHLDVIIPELALQVFVAKVEAKLKAAKVDFRNVDVELEVVAGESKLHGGYKLTYFDIEEKFTAIDGKYPDTKRVVPRLGAEVDTTQIGLDMGYMSTIFKTTKLLTKVKTADPVMHFYGSNNGVRFTWQWDDKATVVLMPKRV